MECKADQVLCGGIVPRDMPDNERITLTAGKRAIKYLLVINEAGEQWIFIHDIHGKIKLTVPNFSTLELDKENNLRLSSR